MGRPLKIAKAQAILTLTSTTAATKLVTVTNDLLDPTDPSYGVTAGMPFVPATTVGTNLVAGTTYWLAIHSSSTPFYSAYNNSQLYQFSSNGTTIYIGYLVTTITFGSAPTTLTSPVLTSASTIPFIGINF